MKYTVDYKKFAQALSNRPSLIKKVTVMTVEAATLFVGSNRLCYPLLPREFKSDINVVRAYIGDLTKKGIYQNVRDFDFSGIPFSVLKELNEEDRKMLIGFKSSIISSLHSPSKSEYYLAVRKGYDTKKVPEEYYKDINFWSCAASYYRQTCYASTFKISEVFWEENDNAEKIISQFLEEYPERIDSIPSNRVTRDNLFTAFKSTISKEKELDLSSEEGIPDSSWDETIKDMALLNCYRNIRCIPIDLLSEKDALNAIERGAELYCIPDELNTRNVRVHSMAYIVNYNKYPFPRSLDEFNGDKKLFKNLQSINFQLDVLKRAPSFNVSNSTEKMMNFIEEKNYLKILKVNPTFLKFIPKLEQTDEQIDVFFSYATSAQIDAVSEYINMGKIKDKHSPILIGCESSLIVTAVAKRLKKSVKLEQGEVRSLSSQSIEIEVPPTEYAKICDMME